MATVDAWIVAGQSNARGRGDSSTSPTVDPALAWEYNDAGGLTTLDDPGASTASYNADTGSFLPAFANAYTAASGRPSAFVRTAIGGTSLLAANATGNGGWHDGGTRFPNSVTRGQALLDAITGAGHTVGSVGILWNQGERDAQGGSGLAGFEAAMVDLLDRYTAAFPSHTVEMFVARTGLGYPDDANWQAVRDAQDAACAATADMHMIYTRTSDFFDLGWMKDDNLHYTQDGLNDWGLLGGSAAATIRGYSAPTPVVPTGVPSSAIARALMRA